MSSSNQSSLVTAGKPRLSLPTRSVALRPAAAVVSASFLGIGLAYGACMLLIPAWGFEGSRASVLSADNRLQDDVICSSGSSTGSPQLARVNEAVEREVAINSSETTRALSPPR